MNLESRSIGRLRRIVRQSVTMAFLRGVENDWRTNLDKRSWTTNGTPGSQKAISTATILQQQLAPWTSKGDSKPMN